MGRPRLEVAEIFRTHGACYRQSHALGPQQRMAMWSIEHCRTQTLGGHLEQCLGCGDKQPAYNSCRNRHCPKCQSLAQAAWLERRKARILPTHYFHVVFTLPHELNPLCRWNPKKLYDLLFYAASQTLLEFGRKELNVQLGVTAVLHTWTRDLRFHPHLHCVVTGGGLTQGNDRWISTSKRFLFPVRALSKRFRGKFLDGLRALQQAGELRLGDSRRTLAHSFSGLLDVMYRTPWVVYSKAPFGGAEQVFRYLGRYTHRVAIANSRLTHLDREQVCFRTRNGKHATVTPQVFIERFLLHVLPKGFVKIRHYGLMAAGNATTRLEVARTLLPAVSPPIGPCPQPIEASALESASAQSGPRPLMSLAALLSLSALQSMLLLLPFPLATQSPDWRTQLKRLTGLEPRVCPRCGGLRIRQPLPRRPFPPPVEGSPVPQDTS